MVNPGWVGSLLIVGLVAGCAERRDPPNLLLVVVDTLRADHLGCYGYPRDTSPRIDRFAAGAVLFANAFTPVPKTGPAMTSLFTGRYPQRHGVTENRRVVPADEQLLAEVLPAAYRKVAFVANPTLTAERGFAAGFDEFELVSDDSTALTDRVLSWLESYSDGPFFLWAHYLDPHGPYLPPEALREKFVGDAWYDASRRVRSRPDPRRRDGALGLGVVPKYQRLEGQHSVDYYVAQYDAEILHVDSELGRLFDHLEESGLAERTVVVLVSDHGESLGEHDYYFEHGLHVTEGSIRVPLIVRAPGLGPRVVPDLVQTVDLLPTLLQLLGAASPIDTRSEGRDLTPLLSGAEDARGRDWVYACTPYPDEYPTFYETVRTRDGKLVRTAGGDLAFYDLVADPTETSNRIDLVDEPERRRLLERLRSFGRTGVARAERRQVSPHVRERLRALGYMQTEPDIESDSEPAR